MKVLHEAGRYSSAHNAHLVLHEVGHAKHHHEHEARYSELRRMGGIWPSEQRGLARRLSDRAADSPIEFVAEFYAARRLQGVLNPELLASLEALYREFGGPSWE